MAPTRMIYSTAASKGGPVSPPRGRTLSSPRGRTLSSPHCRPRRPPFPSGLLPSSASRPPPPRRLSPPVGRLPSPAVQGTSSSSTMAPTRMIYSTAASKGGPLSPPRGRTLSSPRGRTLSSPHCRPRRPPFPSGISSKEIDEGPSKETDELADEETDEELKKMDDCPPPFRPIQLRLRPTPGFGRPESIRYNLPSPPGVGRPESIRPDDVDSDAMSESSDEEVKKVEAESSHQEIFQEAYNTFSNNVKTYIQHFEFENYLWEESNFVKHDSDVESILSSGILPKDKVSLLRPDMIVGCLERFIHFKKLVFEAEQMFRCKMYMLECDFTKYGRNYEEIVDLLMEKFPKLRYFLVRHLVERYMGGLLMLENGNDNAQKEFCSRFAEDSKRVYQHFMESVKDRRRPKYKGGPGRYHYVFRDIAHKYHSKGLEVDAEILQKEFWEFNKISPIFRRPLHG